MKGPMYRIMIPVVAQSFPYGLSVLEALYSRRIVQTTRSDSWEVVQGYEVPLHSQGNQPMNGEYGQDVPNFWCKVEAQAAKAEGRHVARNHVEQ
jgi:hypothetical protein